MGVGKRRLYLSWNYSFLGNNRFPLTLRYFSLGDYCPLILDRRLLWPETLAPKASFRIATGGYPN